jgi:hypothetical protein
MPTIIIDGKVVGTWKQIKLRNMRKIELKPFTDFTETDRSKIDQAALQYSKFLNEEITVV